ncbi:zinc dependent phospholipase C family protein [Candidatus Woesearchaeota archaeon]|nr:zinc dependent phospholipase C family protein [Candidatus Woesearchaeota archaeon]
MDPLSHLLWVYLAVKFGLVHALNIKYFLIFSLFPDISYIPFWIYHFKKAYRNLGNMVSPTKDMIQNTPWIINKFYFLFHSIPFILFFSLVVGLIFGLQMFFTVLLGWGIHVILDVFSHEGFWATKILYPFSNKSYDFLPWYNSKRFNVVNMALLFFGYLFVYFK